MIDGAAQHIREQQQRPRGQIAEEEEANELEQHGGRHFPLEEGVHNEQLLYLGVCFCENGKRGDDDDDDDGTRRKMMAALA